MKKAMLKLNVNDIFYSVQGEGARTGSASIFIRLQGCNLACKFCDTEFDSGKEMDLNEIYNIILKYPCNWIVWTGGEPAMQLTEEITEYFKFRGYLQAIETNGAFHVPNNLDWVTLSPKVSENSLIKKFPKGVTELKYVWNKNNKSVPKPKITALFYFLLPQSEKDNIIDENVEHCIELCKKYPKWRVSPQLHKIWNIK
jgi:7-carboxy-7-deazaguanine synthase